ncbi:MAG: hypothetical protein EBU85_01255 [Actinobacteria bacterium]|nr:hypothetical protein [Actinomycetota bacterium]
MQLDQVLPEDTLFPAVATAFERGNVGLAVAIVADEIDACDPTDAATLVHLHVQGILAARLAGHTDQAKTWVDAALRIAAAHDARSQVLARAMRVFVAADSMPKESLRAEAEAIQTLLKEVFDEPARRFGQFATLFALIVGGDLAAARAWLDARAQVCEAVIEYLDANGAAATSVLELLQPLTLAANSSIPLASMWWEIAELRHSLGQEQKAWESARRAIDASTVRPPDGHSSFAPGVLSWELTV